MFSNIILYCVFTVNKCVLIILRDLQIVGLFVLEALNATFSLFSFMYSVL